MRHLLLAAPLVLLACPAPPGAQDAGTSHLPPAGAPFLGADDTLAAELHDAGAHGPLEALIETSLRGPENQALTFRLTPRDGGAALPEGVGEQGGVAWRVDPWGRYRLAIEMDGGLPLDLPVMPGAKVTPDFVRMLRGFPVGRFPRAAFGVLPWQGAHVHRQTGTLVVAWAGKLALLVPEPGAPFGVRRVEVGDAEPNRSLEPCFFKEGTLALLPLLGDRGEVWDLATGQRVSAPADLHGAVCLSARRGVKRALVSTAAGELVVITWGPSGVTELLREPPGRAALSADGSTAAFSRQGASASGWVAERVVIDSGARHAELVQGPATLLLPFDGSRLLALADQPSPTTWQPCSSNPADWCALFGAPPQRLGNVLSLAVSETQPRLLVAVRDFSTGVGLDALVQVDLAAGTQTKVTSTYAGLPPSRVVVAGHVLPVHSGFFHAETGLKLPTPAGPWVLASDGFLWVANRGALHPETGALERGRYRPVFLPTPQTRALGTGDDARLADAACVPSLETQLFDRQRQPLLQVALCTP